MIKRFYIKISKRATNIALFVFLFFAFNNFILSQNQPTTILVSLDGFRWDYLQRSESAYLNSIADVGVRALSLKSVFPTSTFPCHYSIITGRHPDNHGIIANSFHDLFSGEKFSIGSAAMYESKWWRGEAFWETAKLNGIKTASYFWPGSEISDVDRRPDFYEKYEHTRPYEVRVEGVLRWLTLPENIRPKFITLYFDAADSRAHSHGIDSPELNEAITLLDRTIRNLDLGLKKHGIKDSVNLIIVSDHGMTTIDSTRIFNVRELIPDDDVYINAMGPFALIQAPKYKSGTIFTLLKQKEKGYKAYFRNEMPENFNLFSNPLLTDIILVADIGWLIQTDYNWSSTYLATHGYDNSHMDMHGIFIARGPSFKSEYRTGTLNSIDIYPMLCKIFGIRPAPGIDGRLSDILQILKD
ncbi:MAG: alkaline phosphatase family protein [Desulfobulbaceae bacterium]|nr:alkaline phosphatase family protein [Candidatus Kapabacteria bacterium]MBS3999397.1 alkaline phosphatase family protein [Desulfobulbaceae bacterium]